MNACINKQITGSCELHVLSKDYILSFQHLHYRLIFTKHVLFIKWQWHCECLQKKATVCSKVYRTLIFSYKEETTHLICKNTSIYNQLILFVSFYANVNLSLYSWKVWTTSLNKTNNNLPSVFHFNPKHLLLPSRQISNFTTGNARGFSIIINWDTELKA